MPDHTPDGMGAAPPPGLVMPGPGESQPGKKKGHWAVLMNHRNRTWSFALLCGILVLHLWPSQPGPQVWLALATSFLLYPRLALWAAMRSVRPLQAELWSLRVDGLMFSVWTAYLGFPLWIGFAMVLGFQLNMMLFQGLRGLLQGSLLFAAGCGMATGLLDPVLHTATSLPVTLLCMVGLSAYVMAVAHEAHGRSLKLSLARRALRDNAASLRNQLTEIQALQSRLREQAHRDPLTGLYNRRYLDATLVRELARCQREQAPLSLILIDADHFKAVNDQHGHATGDAVLRHLGQALAREARASDVVCRYGGEEFLLVLPGMDVDSALRRAEELRASFALSSAPGTAEGLHVTLSVGVAAYPQHGHNATELLAHADQAMYKAKSQGRNRVESYAPVQAPASV